jgi:hypothetical protein
MLISLPALAGKSCDQPYVPDIKSGVTLSKLDLSVMRDDAQAFIDASDLYQKCLERSVNQSSLSRPEYNSLLIQNQRDKQRIGDQVNALIAAYNTSLHASTKISNASH